MSSLTQLNSFPSLDFPTKESLASYEVHINSWYANDGTFTLINKYTNVRITFAYSNAYGGTLYRSTGAFEKISKRDSKIPNSVATAGLYEVFMSEWMKTNQYARFSERQRVKDDAAKDAKAARTAEAERVKSEQPTCGICFENCNLSNRIAVRCPYCPLVVCRECTTSYILQTAECRNVGCPECRTGWSDEFLDANMTAKFMLGEFKEGYSKILIDQERARLPETQADAARYRDAAKIAKRISDEIGELKARIAALPSKIESDRTRAIHYKIMQKFWMNQAENAEAHGTATRAYKAAHAKYIKEAKSDNTRLIKLQRNPEYAEALGIVRVFGRAENPGGRAAPREVKQWSFTMKCPSSGCEGFVGLDWKCGLCKATVCESCREIVKEDDGSAAAAKKEHVCNPDIVASVKALTKEAKPCPKCAASISKIDGCDQMWCTQCHTAFSWRTGAIETTVHNPHYYEWRRRNGGLPPNPAAGVPLPAAGDGLACLAPQIVVDACIDRTTTVAGFSDACRMIIHAERSILQQLRNVMRTGEETRRVLRVRRLVGEISEAEWMDLLHRQDKAERRSTRVRQIIELYSTAGMDILRRMAGDGVEHNDTHAAELLKLRDYCQQNLLKLKKTFGTVPSLI